MMQEKEKIAGITPVLNFTKIVGALEVGFDSEGRAFQETPRDRAITSASGVEDSGRDVRLVVLGIAVESSGRVTNVLGFASDFGEVRDSFERPHSSGLLVDPDFSTDSINAVNGYLYRNFEVPETQTFTVYVPYHRALSRFLLDECDEKDYLKVLNLGSGRKGGVPFASASWDFLNHDKKLDVTVSDVGNMPANDVSVASFKKVDVDILQDFPVLDDSEKYDVMVANYLFDSVWAPEDVRYEMVDRQWYKKYYRVRLNPTHSMRNEIIGVLRSGKKSDGLNFDDFNQAVLYEEAVELVDDISKVPYGEQIMEYYGQFHAARINFPGGVINKVQEAFDTQLKNDGVFLIGSSAVPNKATEVSNYNLLFGHCDVVGMPVQFKVEDWGLAKHILEGLGYEVSIKDFYRDFCELSWEEKCELDREISAGRAQEGAVQVMEVRKK